MMKEWSKNGQMSGSLILWIKKVRDFESGDQQCKIDVE
jgi:hypothetical protein